jgi:hypothetical protein
MDFEISDEQEELRSAVRAALLLFGTSDRRRSRIADLLWPRD